jgi:prophage antirepressor-like protein/phage anti-repressor protein
MKNIQEILRIGDNQGQKIVSARDLHTFLESKVEFGIWIKDRIEKGKFKENQDYWVFKDFKNQPLRVEYAITIPMAEELCEVEEAGKNDPETEVPKQQGMAVFEKEEFGKVRVVMDEQGEPLFCLVDVCKVLGLTTPSDILKRLEEDEVIKIDFNTSKFQGLDPRCDNQSVKPLNFITESGLYSTLSKSDKPQAKPFQRWLTREVLPSIRKTGKYETPQAEPKTDELAMAHGLLAASRIIEKQKQQIEELTPYANYTKLIMQSVTTYTSTQVAKQMGMTAARLHILLRDHDFMFVQSGQWVLTKPYQNKGYTQLRTWGYQRPNGLVASNSITVWTERGRAWIHYLVNVWKVFDKDIEEYNKTHKTSTKYDLPDDYQFNELPGIH